MRLKGWIILLAFVLFAGNVQISFSVASGRNRTKPGPKPAVAPAVRAVAKGDNIVDGYGPTAAIAKDWAMKHAQERVETLLRERFAADGWKPNEEQLSADYLIRHEVVTPQGEPEPSPGINDNEKAMVARYKVELTPSYLKEVQRLAREQRVQERHLVLARLLGWMVVLLLVVAGYLRLEDMTRGYATTLLRLGAFTLVAVAGAALWLTM
jgi:hypothetical protein